jgi:curli biogenesis system outer membrane secretion channel CsgG
MKQFIIGLMAVMLMCLAACATQKTGTTMAEPAAATVADAGALPDIAPYDDAAIPALDAPATE